MKQLARRQTVEKPIVSDSAKPVCDDHQATTLCYPVRCEWHLTMSVQSDQRLSHSLAFKHTAFSQYQVWIDMETRGKDLSYCNMLKKKDPLTAVMMEDLGEAMKNAISTPTV